MNGVGGAADIGEFLALFKAGFIDSTFDSTCEVKTFIVFLNNFHFVLSWLFYTIFSLFTHLQAIPDIYS